jgi:uncharacterized DUF497 family protein
MQVTREAAAAERRRSRVRQRRPSQGQSPPTRGSVNFGFSISVLFATLREEGISLISMRPARKDERKLYEQARQER